MQRRRLIALSVAWWAPAVAASSTAARVAAASDLQFALPAVVERFHRTTPHRVGLSFGSSGNLARQIQQGAALDLFLSADERFALRLAAAGLSRDRGALYAIGRIALIVPVSSAITLDERLEGIRRDWPQIRKFALANPEHAPYGMAAREALQTLELWPRVQGRVVLGENISQATQYVAAGAAQAGITALSLALAPAVAAHVRHLALPASLHRPLRQRMVLMKNARPAAAAFYEFLGTPQAREVMAAYGFALPRDAR